MPEIEHARFITKAIIAEIKRGLRCGKSPKEIAKITGETHENIRIIMYRYKPLHTLYAKTYFIRNPTKHILPRRLATVLREV